MSEYFDLSYIEEQMGEKITGVIHVGAHYAEEAEEYASLKVPVVWFEGHPTYAAEMMQRLKKYDNQIGVPILLSNKDDETVDFWITADEYASSMLKPSYHQIQNPHAKIVDRIWLKARRFDAVWPIMDLDILNYNLLVLDVQGAEARVWEGMSDLTSGFKAIVSEYSTVEFYEGVPKLSDLDLMYDGFERIDPKPGTEHIHADALYVRKEREL